ncbi:hypothetical protein B9G55_07105 [Saccharibacillus sp. O16]|nr:hypothetical protein B9G55_07105 [Saccharibacillus sp. O16]
MSRSRRVTEMNILIIADDSSVIGTITEAISQCEPTCTIFEASSPQEALEWMSAASMNIVFSEIHMSRMNGLAFLEAHQSLFANVCWIAISEFKSFYDIQKAIKLGGRDYLLKPMEEPILHGLLEGLIHTGKPYWQGGYDCEPCSC